MPAKTVRESCVAGVFDRERHGQARVLFFTGEIERLPDAEGPGPCRRAECVVLERQYRTRARHSFHAPRSLPAHTMDRMRAVAEVARQRERLSAESESCIANPVGIRDQWIATGETHVRARDRFIGRRS